MRFPIAARAFAKASSSHAALQKPERRCESTAVGDSKFTYGKSSSGNGSMDALSPSARKGPKVRFMLQPVMFTSSIDLHRGVLVAAEAFGFVLQGPDRTWDY